MCRKAVLIDGTHIKANANTKKQIKEQIRVASEHYVKELMKAVNADREEKFRTVTKSKNDPDRSLFVKGDYKRQFADVAYPPAK